MDMKLRFTALRSTPESQVTAMMSRSVRKRLTGIGRTQDVTMLPWRLTSSLLCDDLLLIDFPSSEVEGVSWAEVTATRLLV